MERRHRVQQRESVGAERLIQQRHATARQRLGEEAVHVRGEQCRLPSSEIRRCETSL